MTKTASKQTIGSWHLSQTTAKSEKLTMMQFLCV